MKYNLTPKVHFTKWDNYAIMSMAENGLGVSILPQLILKRNGIFIKATVVITGLPEMPLPNLQ